VDYVDDESIEQATELWRRVTRDQIIHDQNLGVWRPTSAAFSDSSDGTPMSVDIASIIRSRGGDERTAIAQYPGLFLVSLTAEQVRAKQLGVCRSPQPDNPAHAYVFGDKTKSIRKYLAKSARWVVAP
jgi:hypothetical protein